MMTHDELINDLYEIVDVCSRIRGEFRTLMTSAINEFLMELLAEKTIDQGLHTELVKTLESSCFTFDCHWAVSLSPGGEARGPLEAEARHFLDMAVEVAVFESILDELDEDMNSVTSSNVESEIDAFVGKIGLDFADGRLKEVHYDFLLNWIETISLIF
ncbi:hypothetical protein [Pseudomonas syringae]|uniref:hypothetical protein n=1 Tax=Pseudomonas syringae TaxID=317 RepID=UPI0006A90640|nr:hypothetical protein [Pseudomonas syringae]PIN57877.1 hypothetical protein CUB86_31100 [Pseudomonas syringae pv. actinidiae]GAO94545.1 hypothetical protein PSA5_17530 [Pseudomonas syringae pv. actinidiae]